MAQIQVIHACFLLLAVMITYHDILYTEGRPIKSLNKHEFSSRDSGPGTLAGSQRKKEGKKEVPPPMMPNYSVGFGDSTVVYEDDTKPGELGNSTPSVGHSATAYKDDYRPTKPGHSPGVGHSLHKENAEPNA